MLGSPTPKSTRVSLLAAPTNPLGTLLYVWLQSRHNDAVPSPAELQNLVSWDIERYPIPNDDMFNAATDLGFENKGERRAEVARTWLRNMLANLLGEAIPVVEFLNFTFELENIPISLREQLVRHRIGTAVDPRLGADIVPHVAESAFWALGARMLDYSDFYDNGDWHLPDTLKGVDCQVYENTYRSAEHIYRDALNTVQTAYRLLQEAGIPIEDCRQLLPVGVTHRIAWNVNFKSMKHILGRRSCWVTQLDLWEPVVTGMASELRVIDPLLGRSLTDPPCFKAGEFSACPFNQINAERLIGKEGAAPPCSLWLHHNAAQAKEVAEGTQGSMWVKWHDTGLNTIYGPKGEIPADEEVLLQRDAVSPENADTFPGDWVTSDPLAAKRMAADRQARASLWGRDVDTGAEVTA